MKSLAPGGGHYVSVAEASLRSVACTSNNNVQERSHQQSNIAEKSQGKVEEVMMMPSICMILDDDGRKFGS
jgi:hypothetical protein